MSELQRGPERTPPPGVHRGGKTLSVMPTYRCNAACRDCGTFSNPDQRIHLAEETIRAAIDEAVTLGFANVVFTGGEPTLRWPSLLRCLRYVAGRLPTRIVTNAVWAVSVDKAEARLRTLRDAGLDEINFSTGDEHVRFVPVERVVNAMIACNRIGMVFHTMVERRRGAGVTKQALLRDPRLAAAFERPSVPLRIEESPWMPVDPAAVAAYPPGDAITEANVQACRGCDSVLQTYVLQADGVIGACCGLGMRTTPELHAGRAQGEGFLRRAVTEAEADLVKLALRYIGPEKLLRLAAARDPGIRWEGLYAHRCQSCMRLYKDPRVVAAAIEAVEAEQANLVAAACFDEVALPAYMAESES